MLARRPDFFVIGAPKTATTSLFEWLKGAPGFATVEPKEPGFFCYESKGWRLSAVTNELEELPYLVTEEEFSAAFESVSQQLRLGDFTTHYLYFADEFIRRVEEHFPRPREVPIVIMLRDPVERAYSHYMMKVRDGHEPLTFSEAIRPDVIRGRIAQGFVPSFDYIGFSEYRTRVAKIEAFFENVLVLDYRTFISDSAQCYRALCAHLGISDVGLEPEGVLRKHNVSGVPAEGVIARLGYELLYQPNRLKAILPRRLSREVGRFAKRLLGPKVLRRRAMTPAEREDAARLLGGEIDYYQTRFGELSQ